MSPSPRRSYFALTSLFVLLTGLIFFSLSASAGRCRPLFLAQEYPPGTLPLSGYASVFGKVDSKNQVTTEGSFLESIEKFSLGGKGFYNGEVKMLFKHDPTLVIGEWTYLREDAKGLYIEGYVDPRTPAGQKFIEEWTRNPLRSLSIGVIPKETTIDPKTGAKILHKVNLVEISLVRTPANREASFEINPTVWPTPKEPFHWLKIFGWPKQDR
jgi:HK97 family phage prohead protease